MGSEFDQLSALRANTPDLPADVLADVDAKLDIAIPDCGSHLFDWFLDLSAHGRAGSGFGPAPITYSEILAWRDMVRRHPIHSWEIEILMSMDSTYRAEVSKLQEEDK